MLMKTVLALTLSSAVYNQASAADSNSSKPQNLNERRGNIPVSEEFVQDFSRRATELLRNAKPIPATDPLPPERPELDLTRSDATGICFGTVEPVMPWNGTGDFPLEVRPRAWTCESRDSVVKAIALTGFFLKGTNMVCKFTPLPQAQLAARVFDVASFASQGIGLVVSVTSCENTMETKVDALVKACEGLQKAGAGCQGVDNTPF